jgi:hypothetical protein
MTVQNVIEKAYSTTPTASTIAEWDANVNLSANNHLSSYTTTATAAGTTVLTVASTFQQFFTGSTTQTVTMPVTSTLALGQSWYIVNNSSGVVTLQSSGGNTIVAMAASTVTLITCILTSGTGTASWYAEYEQASLVLPLSLANGGTGQSLSSVNSAVFSTTSGGVSQLSATLPASLNIPTPIIKGSNGFNVTTFADVASATDYLSILAGINNAASIQLVSSQTNASFAIAAKGTGGVAIGAGQTTATPMTLNYGAFNIGFVVSAITASRSITFPDGNVVLSAGTLPAQTSGSWTPIDSSGASLTFSTAIGSYVQTGNMVVASCEVVYPATASGATAIIGGLPFTTGSTLSKQGGSIQYCTAATVLRCATDASATTVHLYTAAAGSVANSVMSGATLIMQLVYLV